MHLTAEDVRTVSTSDFSNQWREELGTLIGVESAQFESDIGGPGRGKALTVELSHRDEVVLQKAGEALADISRQVRAAFYGSEAARQQRGRHEIKILVRLANGYRDSEYDIN